MCKIATEMGNLKQGFISRIGARNTELDVLYAQLHLDTARALEKHGERCEECGVKRERVTA